MLGFDSRAARAAWTIFVIALLLLVIYSTRRVLLVFVLSVLFAYLLAPVVNFVDRITPRRVPRACSLAVVYALLVGVLVIAGITIGNRVAEEAASLAKRYPDIVAGLKEKLASPDPAWLAPAKRYVLNQINEHAQSFGTAVVPIVRELTAHVASVASSLVLVVLIPILSFFFLKDGEELREQMLSLAGPDRRPMWEDILADTHLLLGQFIRALVILSAATFVVYSVFLSIMGLPYAVLLAAAAALLEFIPMIGPAAAVLIIIVATVFSGAGHILIIIIFIACYRMFQDYFLNPHLMGAGIELHPVLVIFGALAGEEIAGIPGMFLSVPVLATLRVIYVRIRKARVLPPRTIVSETHTEKEEGTL